MASWPPRVGLESCSSDLAAFHASVLVGGHGRINASYASFVIAQMFKDEL